MNLKIKSKRGNPTLSYFSATIKEIQEKIEEYKLSFDDGKMMGDSHLEHLKNLELAEEYRSSNRSIEDDIEHKEISEANIDHITSELAQAESQIKRITNANDTFKNTFEDEELKFDHSEEDFNPNISVNTSEGSLSRDGTEEVKNSYAEYDFINNHLVEVSPDSPIEQKDRINYTQLNSQIAFPNIGEDFQVSLLQVA